MDNAGTVVAVLADKEAAEEAVKKLTAVGFDMNDLSVVGKGQNADEKTVGYLNVGNKVEFWGERGAFWGTLWGLFSGGLLLTAPVTGPVVVLGYLATLAVSAIEGAAVVGGVSAVTAALLYFLGVPKDSVTQYEAALLEDDFLVMVRGNESEVALAHAILSAMNPIALNVHEDAEGEENLRKLRRG